MGIWKENDVGTDRWHANQREMAKKQIEAEDKMATINRRKDVAMQQMGVNVLNTPTNGLGNWTGRITSADMRMKQPIEPSYPLEGRGIRTARDLQEIGDSKLLVALLCDMVTSNEPEERFFAAMHRQTPMSSITMHLLADKDSHVRYFAEKRVEAWEGEDGAY